MSYAKLLHNVPDGLRRLYRKYENVSKKLINTKWSIEFNSTCIKENMLPNFSRLHHYDPAIASTRPTKMYRKYLVEREITEKQKSLGTLEQEKDQCLNLIKSFKCDSALKNPIEHELQNILNNSNKVAKTKILKKLSNLYHCNNINCSDKKVLLKDTNDSFVNLSSYHLSQEEEDFLNLGLNCHLQPKYDRLTKQTELEILYQRLLELEAKKVITIKPELADQLRGEGVKHRNPRHQSILTDSLKTAAKSLKNNENIVIRKADKSAVYVIMDKVDYIEKINQILSDPTKFRQISTNPTEQLKCKANKLIDTLNAMKDDLKLPKIIGDFQPGYIYGNVKTHKNDNPLRPIISQIPMPTYNLAKSLNQIITPYIPSEYTLKSSSDFIDLLQFCNDDGTIGSLDVESLFTNVPIDETIDNI